MTDYYNIFEKDKSAVKHFCKFSRTSSPLAPYFNYAKVAMEILHRYFPYDKRLNVLECGIGYGRFGIPLAKEGKPHNIFVYGFDSSPYMKREFDKQLKILNCNLANIEYRIWNPELWQPANNTCPYEDKFFHTIQFFEFLYYLHNWRQEIDKFLKLLKADGLIIIDQEMSSYMYSVNGEFTYYPTNKDLMVANFWKEYYQEKKRFSSNTFIKRDISPCNYQEVLRYLESKGFVIKQIEDERLCWKRTLSFHIFLEMIRKGFIPFITLNLSANAKEGILKNMKHWLSQNRIDPHEKFNIQCKLILYVGRHQNG